jgi:hypothetical protein
MIDQLQWLAQTCSLFGRERDLVVLALVLNLLATPHLAADVDDLAGTGDGCVVLDAVEALDHLGSRSSEAEHETPVGNVVEARGGHGSQGRRAGVDLKDSRRDLDRRGLGRQESELAHCVERVRLGYEDDVQPGFFELGHLGDRFIESPRVVNHGSDVHRCSSQVRCALARFMFSDVTCSERNRFHVGCVEHDRG